MKRLGNNEQRQDEKTSAGRVVLACVAGAGEVSAKSERGARGWGWG